MGVLTNLKPEKVFYYFEELCKIPHGSYNTKAISDYCLAFAKERDLPATQDAANNIVIKKPGTAGYEAAEPVILQGHLDMVCEKTPGSTHDFTKNGIDLVIEDGYVKAKDTSLGGDDCIAVAMVLAILDSSDIPHPPIEAVFTTEEEVSMEGADALDLSQLVGTRLINIDSEDEGVFTVGCAGGYRFDTRIPAEWTEAKGAGLSVRIHGLLGGHSGQLIHLQRGNAHVLMGRLLNHLSESMEITLASIEGGSKSNVIAAEDTAVILVAPEQKEACIKAIREVEQTLKNEIGSDDPELAIDVADAAPEEMLTKASTEKVLSYLAAMPDGVMCFERAIPGQVETSLNCGVIVTEEQEIVITHLIRSSMESKKAELKERLRRIASACGAVGKDRDEYPAWAYRKESALRDTMASIYKDMYQKDPQIVTVHAGLECGLFIGKRPELDCISIGPDLEYVHSTAERMSIASVERTYEYLLAVLKSMH